MEVIADELQKNGVPVDIETLSEHIEYILGHYRDSYNEAVNALNNFPLNIDMFQKDFKEINVDSTGTGGRGVIFVLSMQNFVKFLLTFSLSSH